MWSAVPLYSPWKVGISATLPVRTGDARLLQAPFAKSHQSQLSTDCLGIVSSDTTKILLLQLLQRLLLRLD